MRHNLLLGGISIVAAVLPGWIAVVSALGFGASPTIWMVLHYGVPALSVLIAGVLLALGQKSARAWALSAWVLLLLVAGFDLATTWWSFAPGGEFPSEIVTAEIGYLLGSAAMLWAVAKRHSQANSPQGA